MPKITYFLQPCSQGFLFQVFWARERTWERGYLIAACVAKLDISLSNSMVVLLHIWYLLKRSCISPPRCTVSRLSLIGHLYKTDT